MDTGDDNVTGGLSDQEKKLVEALKPHQERLSEISRRKEIATSCGANANKRPGRTSCGSTDCSPGEIPSKHGYDFAIICKGHRGLRPASDRPAFRILGLFHNPANPNQPSDFDNWLDDLRNTSNIFGPDGSCTLGDIEKLPTHKYTLIPKNVARAQNDKYVLSKIEEIKRLHAEATSFADKEFKQHITQQSKGEMGLSLDHKRKEASQKPSSKKHKKKTSSRNKALKHLAAEKSGSSRSVARVPRNLEIRGQNYAVIVVLTDVTENVLNNKDDPEPIFMIIDAFDKLEEAEKFSESVKNKIFNVDINVVDMYVWLFPEDVEYDQIQEKYRHSEQDKVMQAKKLTKHELEEAQQKAEREGKILEDVLVTKESEAPEDFNPLKYEAANFSYEEINEKLDREALEREGEKRAAELGEEGGGALTYHSLGVEFV